MKQHEEDRKGKWEGCEGEDRQMDGWTERQRQMKERDRGTDRQRQRQREAEGKQKRTERESRGSDLMWSGVVPQQPPTMFTRPACANAFTQMKHIDSKIENSLSLKKITYINSHR